MKPMVRIGRLHRVLWFVHTDDRVTVMGSHATALCYAQARGSGLAHWQALEALMSRVRAA